MEPLSTIALLATLVLPATAIPSRSFEKTKKHEHVATSIISKKSYCVVAVDDHDDEEVSFVNSASDVFSQLVGYLKLEPGWDGPGSVAPSASDIELAKEFVASIPAVYPIPKAMLSGDGIVGLYWDDVFMYVDIQFESDHTLSIFSRDRASGKEEFIDSIDVATTNPAWFFDTLGGLFSPARDLLSA